MSEKKVEKRKREKLYKKRVQGIRDLMDEVNRWCRKVDERKKN